MVVVNDVDDDNDETCCEELVKGLLEVGITTLGEKVISWVLLLEWDIVEV